MSSYYFLYAIRGYGFGAEAFALFIGLSVGLFFSGKKIEENLDSWIRLGKRLSKAILRLRKRRATALAISHVIDIDGNDSRILPVSSVIYHIPNPTLDQKLIKLFKENPYRYYIFGFSINDKFVRIICMNSYGEIILTYKLPLRYFEF